LIDVFVLRIIAVILLVSLFLLIYVVNFKGEASSESYEVRSEIQYPTWIEIVGSFAIFIVPIGTIILLVLFPAIVYETIMNLYFIGDTLVQLIGVILYLMGGILLIWSARHLGKYDNSKIAVTHDHVLVDTGPYARVRHPGYTATFLLTLAVLLIVLNVLLIVNLVVAAGYFGYRARLEEKLLSSQEGLGDKYLNYMNRTGRFFPRIR
jgi:protein-S-isoprenylcysteine O-methyltransferase Ste14